MKKSDFDVFYNNVIKALGERMEKEYPNYRFVDNSTGLYEEYLNQKTIMHTFYLKENTLLDRHKVCACMTVAIVKVRLLSYKKIDDEEYSLSKASRVNEQLAFMSAWELLLAFIVAGGRDVNNYEIPKTFHNDSFVDTVTGSLFMSNQMNMLSTPLIANIYFVLERYCEKQKC